MKIAVSNSSPLILLAKIHGLDMLHYSFEKIYIPPAVHYEVVEKGIDNGEGDAFLIKELIDNGFIQIKNLITKKFPYLSKSSLHTGEIEAIQLALSLPQPIILLDDEAARIFARSLGLTIKGTLGLLIECRRDNKISKEKAIIHLNQLNTIMYLSGELYSFVLTKINE